MRTKSFKEGSSKTSLALVACVRILDILLKSLQRAFLGQSGKVLFVLYNLLWEDVMIYLADAGSKSVNLVGGKAKRLGQMLDAGLPVKGGMVITISEVDEILRCGRVSTAMMDKISSFLNTDVMEFAVRSSAVGEDGVKSWAGQFRTELFVNRNDLAQKMLDCALARDSDAVKAYAATSCTSCSALALVIQEMVKVDTAGVLFTQDPRSGARSGVAVIEAVQGVGESLVSGKREPHRYYVDFASMEIIKEEGASVPSLSSAQISELIRCGNVLRLMFEEEQDVEWAIERGTGTVYLTQSRNITTLVGFASAQSQPIKSLTRAQAVESVGREMRDEMARLNVCGAYGLQDVLTDQNIAELLTPHPTPMAFGLFTCCFAHGDGAIRTGRNEMGYDIGRELEKGFSILVGGQPRCSIIHDAFSYRIAGIPLSDYCKIVGHYLLEIRANSSLANYPEIVLYEQNPSLKFLRQLFGEQNAQRYKETYDRFFDNVRLLEASLAKECEQNFLPQWRGDMATLFVGTATKEPVQLRFQYERICEELRRNACKMFVKVARLGFFAFARLRRLLTELFGTIDGRAHLDILTSGIPLECNPNLRFNVALADLRDGRVSMDNVLSEFGHLSMHELEISVPRYVEQPQMLQQLAEHINGNPREELESNIGRSKEQLSLVLKHAGSKADELAADVRAARTYLALREMVKFEYLKGYCKLRALSVEIGQQLGWDEGLIFYLRPEEMRFSFSSGVRSQKYLAEGRRQLREEHKSLYVPSVLPIEDLNLVGRPPEANGHDVLSGVGVTSVVAEGRVVVVRNADDREAVAALRPGSILVTVTTDPAWSPMLAVVGRTGGLITEVGGLLAHGAIYAREMGIAAVLNVPSATHILKTGMHVRVNGPQGIVEILNK